MRDENRFGIILKWVFKCLVTAGILYYLFQKMPVADVVTAMLGMNVRHILPALFLFIAIQYVRALQFKIFSDKQNMPFAVFELMKINLATRFYGLLLPGELSAGLVKWYKLSSRNKMRAEAVACIVFTRIINMLSLAFLGAAFFLIEMPYNSAPILFSLILGLTILVVLYLSMTNATVSGLLERLAGKLCIIRIPQLLQKKISNTWSSIKLFHKISLSALNYAMLLSLVGHFAGILAIDYILRAVGINISLVSIIWIRAAVVFLQLLPISISGLGVREGAFVFLLSNYNVASSDAMAASLINFGLIVAMAFIGGLFEIQEFFFKDVFSGGQKPDS